MALGQNIEIIVTPSSELSHSGTLEVVDIII